MEKYLTKQHIHQLSEVDSKISLFIDQVVKTKQPIFIKNNSKSTAVLLDIDKYEKLIEELELLRDIRVAEEQLHNGNYMSDEEAKKRLFEQE